MRLAVIGSRRFSDAERMASALEPYRAKMAQLVSGGARGADRLAEEWAQAHGIETRIFHPDRPSTSAYHRRNRLIAENCDLLLAFWDGRSTGTKYTIDYARQIGKPVVVVAYHCG